MSAWARLDDDAKGRNLVAATRHLDLLTWDGSKTSAAQVNEWPRSGLVDRDGDELASNRIPLEIEQATILLAGDVALDPLAFSIQDDDIRSERIGPKSVSYFHRRRSGLDEYIRNRRALKLVRRWIAGTKPTPPFVSGTDGESSFEPADRYGRTRGIA